MFVQWDVYNVYNPKESPRGSAATGRCVVDCRDNLCSAPGVHSHLSCPFELGDCWHCSFPSVPTSLYYTMCTVRCVQCLQSKRVPTSLCCYQLSCRWLSRQLVHVHTSVARLNLVIAKTVPTSIRCYRFPIVGTTFVHLESVHTWVARLNLVNDQGLDYRLKGIYDLKSISGNQHQRRDMWGLFCTLQCNALTNW